MNGFMAEARAFVGVWNDEGKTDSIVTYPGNDYWYALGRKLGEGAWIYKTVDWPVHRLYVVPKPELRSPSITR